MQSDEISQNINRIWFLKYSCGHHASAPQKARWGPAHRDLLSPSRADALVRQQLRNLSPWMTVDISPFVLGLADVELGRAALFATRRKVGEVG